jgi:PAS domain S-box-containing protein
LRKVKASSITNRARVTKDGRQLNVSISVSPLRDAKGDIVGASAIARDITAQKKA